MRDPDPVTEMIQACDQAAALIRTRAERLTAMLADDPLDLDQWWALIQAVRHPGGPGEHPRDEHDAHLGDQGSLKTRADCLSRWSAGGRRLLTGTVGADQLDS